MRLIKSPESFHIPFSACHAGLHVFRAVNTAMRVDVGYCKREMLRKETQVADARFAFASL